MDSDSTTMRLHRIYMALDQEHQLSLLEYAEFLLQRTGGELSEAPLEAPKGVLPEPKFEDVPDEETVTGALARLSRVYSMLDTELLLSQASVEILDGSAMRDRTARQLIDELERFFSIYYQRARLVY